MKLSELGLKSKPQTKYNDHVYISFRTIDGELEYSITFLQSKYLSMRTQFMPVYSKQHYDDVLKIQAYPMVVQA